MNARTLLLPALLLLAASCSTDPTEPPALSTTTPPTAAPLAATTFTSASTTSTAPPLGVPRFETGACVSEGLSELKALPSYHIECGFVIVAMDRDDLDGGTVSLPVAIAKSQADDPSRDPVIYLAGGGGHAHLDYAHYLIDSVGDEVLESRDFIQYNQRGAPDTDPELVCPGYTEHVFSLAARKEVGSLWTEDHAAYLAECDRALVEDGVDLTQFNSAVNAADARDVRVALGYEEANYYGTSYGTRLGLALLRDQPEGVRSMILDSVYPPEVGYYTEYGSTLLRAFEAVFEACSEDTSCAAAYPSLRDDFFAATDRLNTEPITVDSPFGPVSVDGGVFMDAMAIYLYSPAWIPRSPWAMSRVAQGDMGPVKDVVVGAVTAPDISWNMFYAMQCREELPYEDWIEAESLGQGLPRQVREHYVDSFSRFHFEMCEGAVSGIADPVAAQQVESDVPTLVLAGRFDPATPPHWSKNTAAGLLNATYLEFSTLGHGVMRSDPCGLSIGLAFIDNPTSTPDTGCIERLPEIDFIFD